MTKAGKKWSVAGGGALHAASAASLTFQRNETH